MNISKCWTILRGLLVGISLLSASGTTLTENFFSDALGESRSYTIYLPEGYDSADARYPVHMMDQRRLT